MSILALLPRIELSIDFIRDDTPDLKMDTVEPKLVLIWNKYHKLGKKIYNRVFHRITDGECPVSSCKENTINS